MKEVIRVFTVGDATLDYGGGAKKNWASLSFMIKALALLRQSEALNFTAYVFC